MNKYNGEQIRKNTSLWVLIGDCTLSIDEGEGETPESFLFVPRLDRVMYDNETATGEIAFSGAVLIGCGLWYEILDSNGTPQMADPVSLAGVESENDSVLSTKPPMLLPEGMNYSARLRYGTDKLCMTDAVSIAWKGEEEESGESSKMGSGVGTSTIVVIVIVVSVVVVLIVSGIFLILRQIMKKRNRHKQDDMNMILLDDPSDTQQIRSE